jgi:hypothetical protein
MTMLGSEKNIKSSYNVPEKFESQMFACQIHAKANCKKRVV